MTSPFAPLVLPRLPSREAFAERLDQAPEAPGPGLLARLFGGPDPTMGGLLAPDQTQGLARNALLQAGLATVAGSQGGGRAVLPILARGLMGGQQAYQQGFEQALQNAETAQALQRRQRREQIAAKYQGQTNPEALVALMQDLVAVGDYEGARPLAEYLKSQAYSQQGAEGPPPEAEVTVIGPDGQPHVMMVPRGGAARDIGLAPPSSMTRGMRPFVEKDPITGRVTYRDAATGQTVFEGRVTPKETTNAERLAAGQTVRLMTAERTLDRTAPPKGLLTKVLQRRQMMGDNYNWEAVANDAHYTPEERRFLTSAIAFGSLSGYIDSGKVLNETELQRVFNVIPTDQDDEETRAFKRSLRRALIDQGKRTAGRAYQAPEEEADPYSGDPYAD